MTRFLHHVWNDPLPMKEQVIIGMFGFMIFLAGLAIYVAIREFFDND